MYTWSDDSEIKIASDDEVAQACFMGISDSEKSQTKVQNPSPDHSDMLIEKETLSDSIKIKGLKNVVEKLTHSNIALNCKVRNAKSENELLETTHIF